MKISHSASPRNRSSRNSRSPAAGCVITGTATGAVASVVSASVLASADARTSVFAADGPATGSAMDVIGHRFGSRNLREWHDSTDHIGPRIAGNARYRERDRARGALGRNCVENEDGKPGPRHLHREGPRLVPWR